VTKGPEAFRTISEAAEELGVPQHVLRFWETKFSFIRPMKRAGGRRFYRPQDLMVLKGVRVLLHDDGYTIKGVQRLHKELGIKRLLSAAQGLADADEETRRLGEDLEEGLIDQAAEAVLGSGALDEPSPQRLREALEALETAKARLARALSDG
jgi:DNA-binding transcriptional MerR regulator